MNDDGDYDDVNIDDAANDKDDDVVNIDYDDVIIDDDDVADDDYFDVNIDDVDELLSFG